MENDQGNDDDHEDISDEEFEELDSAFTYLMKLVDERMLTVYEAEDLANWAEDKLEEGKNPNWIAAKLLREKKRKQIMSLPKFSGRRRVPQICRSYSQKSSKSMRENEASIYDEPLQRATPISEEAGISSRAVSGEDQWSQFRDEYPMDQHLDAVSAEVWNATMDVKIKRAETLIRELTAQIANKKVSKFKPSDVFDKYARDLKGELITVPLCANRLEFGHLVHPRKLPDPNYEIFKLEIEGHRVFDAKIYGKALMLWTLLEDVRVKTSGFLYSIITYSMQDNLAAQDVIRADISRDFFVHFKRLRERFQINSDLEKERLLTEFYKMALKPKETLREYWGRIQTLVAELRSLGRTILEDDLKRTFFRELPESGKNNFLQLSSMDPYNKNLNDLCLEVIRRNEELESSLIDRSISLNFVSSGRNKFKGSNYHSRIVCDYCDKPGHRYAECRNRIRDQNRKDKDSGNDLMDESKTGKMISNTKNNPFHHKRKPKHFQRYNKHQESAAIATDKNNPKSDEVEEPDEGIQCFLCNQRDDHIAQDCLNADCTIAHRNTMYKEFEKQNMEQDAAYPSKKYRIG